MADSTSDRVKFYNVIILGLGFFFVFTAFQTSGIFQPTSLSSYFSSKCNNSKTLPYADNIGYFNYFIIYGMLSISNWVAAPIVAVLTQKWSLVIGAAGYCLFMAALIRPVIQLIFPAAALLGFCAGFLWTAQGNFLTMNSTDETIGRNSGIFWFMLQQSLVFGNLFVFIYTRETHSQGATCITHEQNTVIYIVLTAFGVCGIGILALLKPIKESPLDEGAKEALVKEDNELVLKHKAGNLQDKGPLKSRIRESCKKPIAALVNSFKLLLTFNMFLLTICFFYTGLELEMWSGVFVVCVGKTENLGASFVALTGICIGIGEIIGGGVFGVFGSITVRRGRDPIIMLGLVVHLVTFLVMYYVLPAECPLHRVDTGGALIGNDRAPQQAVVLMCAVLIGFGDSCFNTQIYSILGGLYKGNDSAPAMALFKFFQSIAAMIGFAYSGYVTLPWQLLIVTLMAVVGAGSFIAVEWRMFAKSRRA